MMTCACKEFNALECARRRHVRSVDDFTRSMEMEEAANFDISDACECHCHDIEEYEEDDRQ